MIHMRVCVDGDIREGAGECKGEYGVVSIAFIDVRLGSTLNVRF